MNTNIERITSGNLLFPLLDKALIHRFMEIEGDVRCYNLLENMISIAETNSYGDYEKIYFKDAASLDTKYLFRINSDFQYAILKKRGELLELEVYLFGNYKQVIEFSKY